MLSNCDNDIPHRSRPTMCAIQGQRWHGIPDIIRLLVLPNSDDVIEHTISSHHLCCPKAIMASHAEHHSTMCATQGTCGHATPDILLSCVMSKGDDNMLRPTSSNRVFFPRDMITSHTRYSPTMYIVQGKWLHLTHVIVRLCMRPKGNYSIAKADIVWSCGLSKGDDIILFMI